MIERFLEYITVEKRYSANTVASYRRDLADFSEFLLQSEAHLDYTKVDKKAVRNFMAELGRSGLSKRTINRKLSSLRSFYGFMLRLGEIPASPLESVESLKFHAEKQIPFSPEEMSDLQLLENKPRNATPLKELIVETLYQTGMRRAELCDLQLDDVDLAKKELRVTGKGNKVRLIPVSDALLQELENYLQIRKPLEANEMHFFIGPRGKKLNDKFVYSAVNSYLSLVSTKKKKSPHILRHSFATHVLDNGAEISKVKKILGHASLASTQVYTSANIEQLKKVFNSAHPRAKKI